MKPATKIWIAVACALVLVGGILFTGVMTMLNWDFSKLSTVKYETNTYELGESIANIAIVTDTANVTFVPTTDGTCAVSCYEQKNVKHAVTVKDGTLSITVKDTRKWYEHIGISFASPKITVSVPQGEYGALSLRSDTGNVEIPREFSFASMDISENTGNVTSHASATGAVKIKTSTGNIRVENLSADSLSLSASTGNIAVSNVTCKGEAQLRVSTGKTELTNVTCTDLTSSGSTGNVTLSGVIVAKTLSVKRDTGNVKLDCSDAAELFIETDTGNVTGSLLSAKVFLARSATGRVDVPKTIDGGRCEISTDTGNIKITVAE